MSEYRVTIISLIWQGYNGIDIIKHFNPISDREYHAISNEASDLRAEIEKLMKDLPPIITSAVRDGFTFKQIFDTITEKGEGLIPGWNLECLISGVQQKLEDEGAPARQAAEKAAREARMAAIKKRTDDALKWLRDRGLSA